MKILMRIVIVILILLAILILARNVIIEKLTRKTVLQTTGFDIEMGGIRAGLLDPVFEITNARLINPEDFAEPTALEIKTLRVKYDLPSFFKEEVHLREVVVDVPRAVLVIREDGESNLARLGQVAQGESKEEPTGKEGEGGQEAKPGKRVRVDTLTLRVGKVDVYRYREGSDKPEVDKYDVNFDRTARDVTDLNVVNGMITAGVIEAVGARALQGFTKAFQQNEGDLEKVGQQVERTAKDVGKQLKGLLKDAGINTDR
jgi:uncharacterized protein involved in outer membrane biogenesis